MQYILKKSTVCGGGVYSAGDIVDVDEIEALKLFSGGAIDDPKSEKTAEVKQIKKKVFCWELGGIRTMVPHRMIDSCWLVCSGHSLPDEADIINQSTAATVCVNNAVRAVHADVFVAADVLPQHREKFPPAAIYGGRCLKVFPRHCWAGSDAPQMTAIVDADFIELDPDTWLSNGRFSPGGYWKLEREYNEGTMHSASSLFLAFQVCVAMGARRIALAGCSLEYNKGNPEYYFDDGRAMSDKYLERKEKQIKFFNRFLEDSTGAFQRAGVEVRNVTEGGNMNAFERMNIQHAEQWLQGGY